MKTTLFLFSMLFALSSFTINPNLNFETPACFDWADEQLEKIVTDPDFGEPLTYEQEHDLWLDIYDFCTGGLQQFQG